MAPLPRLRDILPHALGGVLAFLAQPIALVALVGLVAFTSGRCSVTPERVVEWKTRADALTNRDALSVFHGKQSAGADSSRTPRCRTRIPLWCICDRSPRRRKCPPCSTRDSLAAVAFDSGYTVGWSDAATEATAAIATQRDAYARIEALRRDAVSRADSLAALVKTAPLAKASPRIVCGPGAGYSVSATGSGPALTVGCTLPVLRF
jgi:hypothetical protein